MEAMSWSLGVESGETLRGHFRKGATALIGTEEVVAICLGYLACRKKLEWLTGGSVEGPELNLMDLGLGAAPVRPLEVEGPVSDSGCVGKKRQVRRLVK